MAQTARFGLPKPGPGGVVEQQFDALSAVVPFVEIPANNVAIQITVRVDSAFRPGVTLSIGVTGDPSLLVPSSNVNLQNPGDYVLDVTRTFLTPAAINLFVDGGGTEGYGKVFLSYFNKL